MVKLARPFIVLAAFVTAAMIGLTYYYKYPGKDSRPTEKISCSNLEGGCEAGELHIHFDSAPQVMKPFNLFVEFPGAKSVEAGFAMKGMDMGLNRYRLVSKPSGIWQAEVILPICMQGRGDWLMELSVETSFGSRKYLLGFTAGQKAS